MIAGNLGGGPLEPRGERRAWKLGADNLLIVSVGTGTCDHKAERARAAALDAVYTLQGMISDGEQLAMILLQWMSMPARNWHVDRVVGDLSHDLLGDGAGLQQPLLSFHRYDMRLDQGWLADPAHAGHLVTAEKLDELRDFTNAAAVPELAEIATSAARLQVRAEHFPKAFDAIWQPAARPE